MASTVTTTSPLPHRLLAWAEERFPFAHTPLYLVFYLAALLYGRSVVTHDRVWLAAGDLPGLAGVWSFFLLLRVLDEHKDYALDTRNHPQRALQRGVITLQHLKIAGAIAVGVMVAVSLAKDRGLGPAMFFWAVLMVWTALMAREFFCGDWLQRHLVLYASTHLLVLPLAVIWISTFGTDRVLLAPRVMAVALFALLTGAALEVVRKTRGPEEERTGVDSYTKALGPRGAPFAVGGLLTAATVLEVVLVLHLDPGVAGGALVLIPLGALAWAFASLARFVGAPSESARKRNEVTVGLTVLTGYVVLIAGLSARGGLQWR